MSDIKFSVVIPLYNKEQSIVNTVLSVLKQSYQNFEIVIINDGSTDSSVDAVKTIKDERIRLIHQENKGVSAARNRGIKEAKYEWISFLDGDDLWEINHLKEVIVMMDLFPGENIYVTSFEYSDQRAMFKHERKSSVFKVENYFREAIKEELIWTSIIVVNKKCLEQVGAFNINLNRGEDLELWAKLAIKNSIIKSSKVTAVYRINAENRTTLSKNLEKCHYYHFDFDNINEVNQLNYCKIFLFNRISEYILVKDYKTAINLINRYPCIKKVEFIVFFYNFLFKVFYRKFINKNIISRFL